MQPERIVTRRAFVKAAALGVSGLLLESCVPGPSRSPEAVDSGIAESGGRMSWATVVTWRSAAKSTPLTITPSANRSRVASAFE